MSSNEVIFYVIFNLTLICHLLSWCEFQSCVLFIISLLLETFLTALLKQ